MRALTRIAGWRRPLLWAGEDAADRADTVLAVAALLGILTRTGSGVARAAATGPWLDGADVGALAGIMTGHLHEGAERFLVAGDHTIAATEPLTPGVSAELAMLAERTSSGSGGATTWRITPASLRGALDRGRSADQILGFLRTHSRTPLPQTLEYVVEDAGRQHGQVRVGPATTYVRGEPDTLARLVASAAGRRLGLRITSPGTAVTTRPEKDVLAALRRLGEAPVLETADGRPRQAGRGGTRHPAPPDSGDGGDGPTAIALLGPAPAEPGALAPGLLDLVEDEVPGGAPRTGRAYP